MRQTHAYLSALITTDPSGSVSAQAKARTYCAGNGWIGTPLFVRLSGSPKFSALSIPELRSFLRESALPIANDVPTEVLHKFGHLAMLIALLHGEAFPTWLGDFHIQPILGKRGSTRVLSFLIAEAPGLDCGTWEEDCVPTRDA